MAKTPAMVSGLALFAAWGLAQAQPSSSSLVTLNIDALPLDQAISSWALQTGYQVLIPSEGSTRRDLAPTLKGSYAPEGALKVILAGTNLDYQFVNPHTVAIHSVAPAGEGVRTRVADATVGSTAGLSSGTLEEVLVTAQKRSERLQDVPVPMTAIQADTLVNGNHLQLQDYYATIPGLNFTMGNRGEPFISIRGITTDIYTNPTIGVVVDDVPYGSSTVLGGGFAVPDIDPSELQQIEVLRGPQGTLYGASSMGGLLKYVTIDPSVDRLSGRVQAGLSSVENGDRMGYSARGSVNVPLSDSFAVRASGFTRRDSGYIDDPTRNADGVNEGRANGGRLSALWKPSSDVSLKVSALFQDSKRDGSPEVHRQPGLSDLQQSALQGAGEYNKKIQAYSANLTGNVGGIEMTSLSGFSINEPFTTIDYTPLLGGLTQGQFGVTGTELFETNKTTRFSQELRLTAPLGEKLSWLMGAFYTHEASSVVSSALAMTNSGTVVGSLLESSYPTKSRDYALFTNLTFQITDRFDLQVGGRESWNRQSYSQLDTGPLVPLFFGLPTPLVTPRIETDEQAFTYVVTPRFKISRDLMLYARLASGYRPGGPNTGCARFAVPCEYDSDTTQNYEVGVKGSVLDNALSFDASLYYVDWKDIQLLVTDPVTFGSFNTNAGRGKSQGLELSIETRPLAGLSVAAWVAWNDAELTEDMPVTSTVVGKSGDRLPVSSRFTSNFSLNQEFALPNSMTIFFGGSVSYVGSRRGSFASVFASPPLRQDFAAYAKTDLRGGLKYQSWSYDLVVNNLTDRRGVLSGGIGHLLPYGFTYIQPRTYGLSLTKTF